MFNRTAKVNLQAKTETPAKTSKLEREGVRMSSAQPHFASKGRTQSNVKLGEELCPERRMPRAAEPSESLSL